MVMSRWWGRRPVPCHLLRGSTRGFRQSNPAEVIPTSQTPAHPGGSTRKPVLRVHRLLLAVAARPPASSLPLQSAAESHFADEFLLSLRCWFHQMLLISEIGFRSCWETRKQTPPFRQLAQLESLSVGYSELGC